jgi:signal peptidase I
MIEKKRRPAIAFLLSVLVSGLGHVYAGFPLAGLVAWLSMVALVFVGRWLLWAWFSGLVVFACLAFTLKIAICVDAARRARKVGVVPLRWYQRWWVYPLLFVAIGLFSVTALPPTWDATTRYRNYQIPSGSLEPTLVVGDRVVVDMWYYRFHKPDRGDIMVFRFPPDPRRDFLDRCIGLPEDTIEIRFKQVILDGQPVDQPYAVYRDPETYPPDAPRGLGKRDNMTPLTVPEGSYFCLGDNRDQSFDSRFWGLVPDENLRGRPLYVYFARDLSRVGKRLVE